MSENVLAPEVFDRLQQAMADDPGGLADLYRQYLTEAGRTLQLQLRNAFVQKDGEMLRRHAHYLKGSSQVVGVPEVARRCAVLEELGSRADFGQAEQALATTSAAIATAQQELVRRLGALVIPAEDPATS